MYVFCMFAKLAEILFRNNIKDNCYPTQLPLNFVMSGWVSLLGTILCNVALQTYLNCLNVGSFINDVTQFLIIPVVNSVSTDLPTKGSFK